MNSLQNRILAIDNDMESHPDRHLIVQQLKEQLEVMGLNCAICLKTMKMVPSSVRKKGGFLHVTMQELVPFLRVHHYTRDFSRPFLFQCPSILSYNLGLERFRQIFIVLDILEHCKKSWTTKSEARGWTQSKGSVSYKLQVESTSRFNPHKRKTAREVITLFLDYIIYWSRTIISITVVMSRSKLPNSSVPF